MKYVTVFHLISDVIKKAGASCVLIGGFAVNYYKVTRQTVDVDFLITQEDLRKIIELFEKEGYKKECHKLFVKLKGNKPYQMDIDFIYVDKETLDGVIKDGKNIKIAGQSFTIPSLEHLIALKLHSIKYNTKFRELTDLPDIIRLIKYNNVDVKAEKFKEICQQYGTDDLYKKIVDWFK